MELRATESSRTGNRERLVQTVLDLAKDRPVDEIRVEEVLETSGIATGSLYHYFDDFGHLVETAMAERYVEILRHGLVLAGAVAAGRCDARGGGRRPRAGEHGAERVCCTWSAASQRPATNTCLPFGSVGCGA